MPGKGLDVPSCLPSTRRLCGHRTPRHDPSTLWHCPAITALPKLMLTPWLFSGRCWPWDLSLLCSVTPGQAARPAQPHQATHRPLQTRAWGRHPGRAEWAADHQLFTYGDNNLQQQAKLRQTTNPSSASLPVPQSHLCEGLALLLILSTSSHRSLRQA